MQTCRLPLLSLPALHRDSYGQHSTGARLRSNLVPELIKLLPHLRPLCI
jgi:hypothetical protein